MNKLLIDLGDYRRIFDTIHSVLLFQRLEPHRSCVHFSMLGCLILRKHYNIESRVVAGLAAYMVDQTDESVLLFALPGENGFTSSESAFHCWVETTDWHVDFTAPLFPDMLSQKGMNGTCERKMFQKQKSEMAKSGKEITRDGDFIASGNAALTERIIDAYVSQQINLDLANSACKWFKKPLEKMPDVSVVTDENGSSTRLKFHSMPLQALW